VSEETWTIGRILQWTQGHFAGKGIDSPRLDAELLLCAVLRQSRVHLYTHYDQPLTLAERDAFRELVRRRARREPVAYILGEREFYGRPFWVTRDVLVPRPETEHLVDAVRDWVEAQKLVAPRLADIGTGSGAIAISLAAELASAEVYASDLSAAALEVARRNAERLEVLARVTLAVHDLLDEAPGPFDVIAANLPYVPEPDRQALEPEVAAFEPGLALFAGAEGLDVIRRLCAQVMAHLRAPGLLALEIGAGQWPAVQTLLQATGLAKVRAVADLQGHPRVALAER
jgi:release factor glutamine methyltransferase